MLKYLKIIYIILFKIIFKNKKEHEMRTIRNVLFDKIMNTLYYET